MSEEVASAMVIHELREALLLAQESAAEWRGRATQSTAALTVLLAELTALREIADIAADYVNAPNGSYDLERIYEALEQAVRRWKAGRE